MMLLVKFKLYSFAKSAISPTTVTKSANPLNLILSNKKITLAYIRESRNGVTVGDMICGVFTGVCVHVPDFAALCSELAWEWIKVCRGNLSAHLMPKKPAVFPDPFFPLSLLFKIQSSESQVQLVVAALFFCKAVCVSEPRFHCFLTEPPQPSVGDWDLSVLSSQRFTDEFDDLGFQHVQATESPRIAYVEYRFAFREIENWLSLL